MTPSHAEKLEAAKDWLGQKWVCHPVNRVKKLKDPIEPYVWKPKILRGKK